jgi:2',3'-cyclic-nucleotide 2'-phosphodiesterase (5'-nucleotidase family)|tara:strand:- start:300 stop:1403 length:1104 start_codon:yes stop_codon:yes gene_type:complete
MRTGITILVFLLVFLGFSCKRPEITSGKFVFVATGNVKGKLVPHNVRRNPYGGLARKATYIHSLEEQGYDPIILDAGELFFGSNVTHNPSAEKVAANTKVVVQGYNLIGCDVLNLGYTDLARDEYLLSELQNVARFPFVSSNIVVKHSGKQIFEPYVIIERSGFKFGVIGLTTRLPKGLGDYELLDPVKTGNEFLKNIANSTDYQIVLFNGTYDEAIQARGAFVDADYMFLSGHSEAPRKRYPPEEGPLLYKLGEFGQSLAVIRLNVEDSDFPIEDISMLIEREKFILRTLNILRGGNTSRTLEELYAGNLNTSNRVKRIKEELAAVQQRLSSATNTSEFEFVHMSKLVEEDSTLSRIIREMGRVTD